MKSLQFCIGVMESLIARSQVGRAVLLHRSWSGGSIFCRVGQDAPICVCGGCRKLDNTWLGMEPARVKLSLQQLENRFEIQTFEFKFSTLRCVSVVFFWGDLAQHAPKIRAAVLHWGLNWLLN